MKNLGSLFILLLINFLLLNQNARAQSDVYEFDVACQVRQVYPNISITEEELDNAQTLKDLNRHYKPSWVKEYKYVEISARHNGKVVKAKGQDNKITPAQKEIMLKADLGSEIAATIHYIPQNDLQHNEARYEDFNFTIDPNKSANFPNGKNALDQYFTERVLNRTGDHSVFEPYNLSSVQFTINEKGQVVNAYIVHSSEDEAIDKILLESICNMPSWTPAQYSNGTHTKQDFVLTVGDMSSCKMNLLNVRNLAVEEH